MSEENHIANAQEAENILNSDVFKLALANLKQEYIQHWLNNRNIYDVSMREDLHKAILLLPEIERHLRIIVDKGKLTKFQADRLKKVK